MNSSYDCTAHVWTELITVDTHSRVSRGSELELLQLPSHRGAVASALAMPK